MKNHGKQNSFYAVLNNIEKTQTHISPIRKPNAGWVRSDRNKAKSFTKYLVKVFQPFDSETPQEIENEIKSCHKEEKNTRGQKSCKTSF